MSIIVPGVATSRRREPGAPDIRTADLRYHFSADEGAFSDLSGTVAAVNDDGVAHWANAGDGQAAALQSTSARRPTFKTGGLNGKPYLLCDRTTQQWFEDLDATQPSGTTDITPFTVFVVTDAVGELASFPAIQGSPATNGGKFALYFRSQANQQHHFAKDAVRIGNVVNPAILMAAAGRNAAGTTSTPHFRFWIRQNRTSVLAAEQNTGNVVTNGLTAMQFLRASGIASGGFFHGRIYEYLMYYDTTLSDAETFEVEDYLADKYGIA